MADIQLTVGAGEIDVTQFINDVKTKLGDAKVPVGVEVDPKSITAFKKQIADMLSTLSAGKGNEIKISIGDLGTVTSQVKKLDNVTKELVDDVEKVGGSKINLANVTDVNAIKRYQTQLKNIMHDLETLKNKSPGSKLADDTDILGLGKSIQTVGQAVDFYKDKLQEVFDALGTNKMSDAMSDNFKKYTAEARALLSLQREFESSKSSPNAFVKQFEQYEDATRKVTQLKNEIKKMQETMSAAGADGSPVKADYESLQRTSNALDTLLDSITKAGSLDKIDYTSFTSQLNSLSASVTKVRENIRSANLATNILDTTELTKADTKLTELLNKAAKAKQQLGASKTDMGLAKEFDEATKSAEEFRQTVRRAMEDSSVNVTKADYSKVYDEASASLNSVIAKQKELQVAASSTAKSGNVLLTAIKGFGTAALQLVSVQRIFSAIEEGIRKAVTSAIELDSAMTQLKIVTGATDSEMTRFMGNATNLAKSLGQSVSDVSKSIETFSRLGYSLEDASELTEFATILSNVAAVDTSEATTGLTSVIKGFNLSVTDAEHVADVLVEVGQKYAVSASEIMEAFERSGAALGATGTSFEKSAGLVAAANAAVQNASTVGKCLPNATVMWS